MALDLGSRAEELRARVGAFVEREVVPIESDLMRALDDEVAAGVPYPRMLEELRARAREDGLWNLFLGDREHGAGLGHSEYAPLCELMGRSPVAPMAFNCAAPDTGNMEILLEQGSSEQRERWLTPLLEGTIRSCFSMTEPGAAGSDPTGLSTRARLDGEEWVIDGHKWFTTGALGAAVVIVMAVTDPDAAPHRRASMILVPIETAGIELVRPLAVMGHAAGPGHWEIRYEGCRVPASNLLGERGAGFQVAQDRLGPGRMHHCMRAVGGAERALELMCRRANSREAFGGPLADKQFVQDFVARSRIELEAARLMVRHAAHKMDAEGKRAARNEISMAKVMAANVHQDVLDRAIQVHGALGVSDDSPLALMWREGRWLRLVDGADEVHKMAIARRELRRFAAQAEPR
ncbi:MAG: acyl-CoA dehydrogenase family protein [Thermoleophilaceae bacterium]|nr:acyl-CoA dehydrogenase family protein [Thermoleophilaceae bacterium]